MGLLSALIEQLLTEDAALTKGSMRVLNNKKLVADLADAMRDDARSNPSAFPPGSARKFQKIEDIDLAHWFLENIDNIERNGYEDVVYSRDGVNSEWIVRRYIAGSHSWEDLTGVMAMNLRDWYNLKNRNMLDSAHKDLPSFNSVRDVGYYMTTHYAQKLQDVRDASKKAAMRKSAKSVKLVDNEDYRIYTTLNRAAGCVLGLGTQWCTANSNYDKHFHTYSDRALLFQLFAYTDDVDENGKKILSDNEKYQFDAGTPIFMDIVDKQVSATAVREKFPYLYTDLASALRAKKSEMENTFKELLADPSLQSDDYKIKTYEIDEEIKKLGKFVDMGYFTDEVRPSANSANKDPQPIEKDSQMENIDKDVKAMMESLKRYDVLAESVAPVIGMKTIGNDVVENVYHNPDIADEDQLEDPPEEIEVELDESADADILAWMNRFSKLGNMKGYGR